MVGAFLKRAAFLGVAAGAVVAHLSLVGIIAGFEPRAVITGLISLGVILPAIVTLVLGSRAATPIRVIGGSRKPEPPVAILAGAVAGLVGGALIALLALWIDVTAPRDVFTNASPALVQILRFGLDAVPGSLAILAVSAISGAVGASLGILPGRAVRAVVGGVVAVLVIGLMEPFIVAILRNVPGDLEDVLYARGGLTVIGAILSFILVAAGILVWGMRGDRAERTMASIPQQRRKLISFGALAVALLVLIYLPHLIGVRLSETLGTVGLYVLLGLGLNIVVGFAGLLDLGYVAFFAVGAYATAILTSPVSPAFSPELPFFGALPFVIIAAALIGLAIGTPVLRLRGDYLAIVTLGLGEIARIVFLSDWLRPYVGGAQGILSLPNPVPFDSDPQSIYYPILFFCVVAAIASTTLANSRVGRAWNAMREDETVAEATGINLIHYKLLAFALGAAFGCIAGAFFATKIGSVFPHSFDILVSINALALIILGGMGNIRGVIVGAIVLVGLPELLREFSEFRLLIYGAVLVAMMLLRPEGLLPSRARSAELHERSDEDDQYAAVPSDLPPPVVTTS